MKALPAQTFALAVFFMGVVSAQIPAEELRSKIGNVRYPPLAEAARVQGEVHLKLSGGAVILISGHPLLAQPAVAGAKAAAIQSEADIEVTYHFVFVDNATSVPVSVTVRKGNAFDRAVLRMPGIKTEKVVLEYICQENAPPANDIKISGSVVEIWIYGKARCVETDIERLTAG